MKINTALILCAGFGKRLNPLTLEIPKPLIELNKITMLENTISIIENLGINNILINTFYLKDQIRDFINKNKFKSNIKIIEDGENILNTGGGVLNMISNSDDNDFLIFNPDTYWQKTHILEIQKMEKFYFFRSIKNILLLVKKRLSFDKNLSGDFDLCDNLVSINNNNEFIFIGCQILNKNLFLNIREKNFPISKIWNILLENNKLYGFESFSNFYHLTNLETFKKLKGL